MKRLAAFLVASLFSIPAFASLGGPKPVTYDENGAPIYRAIDIADSFDTNVYNGTKAATGELNEVGWIGNCTATLVSEKRDVVFTAGHCKGTGSTAVFTHRESGKKINAICMRHKRYNTRTIFNDYAFCKLAQPLPETSQVASFDVTGTKDGEVFLVNGYGKPYLVNLYWGKASQRRISGQDIVTCGPSNLGSGDSGGSLMRYVEDKINSHRLIVGVNSRGGGGCSYFNAMAHLEFWPFAKEVEAEFDSALCGISANCQVPPEPLDCEALYEQLGACMQRDEQPMPASCKEVYSKFAQCVVQ